MELLKTAPWEIKSGAKMETEAEESTADGNFWKDSVWNFNKKVKKEQDKD